MADVVDIPGLPCSRRIGRDGTAPAGPGPAVRHQTRLFQPVALVRVAVGLQQRSVVA